MTRNDPVKHFFIWPALLIVLVISIFPLIYSLTTSFMSLRLVPPIPAHFVGFGNYAELLQNPRFWSVTWTTTIIAFVAVSLQYVIGFPWRWRSAVACPEKVCSVSASSCQCWWRPSPLHSLPARSSTRRWARSMS